MYKRRDIMKEKLLKKLLAEVELLKSQIDSREYKDALAIYEGVLKADTSLLEEKVLSHVQNGANAWLSVWGKNGKFRIYLNCAYRNGYKPNFNPNFIDIEVNLQVA